MGTLLSDGNYLPDDTNLLAKMYSGMMGKHPMVWQKHLWDYKQPDTRETRAREIVYLASQFLKEAAHDPV